MDSQNILLDIVYAQKDDAKLLKAFYDKELKSWVSKADNPNLATLC